MGFTDELYREKADEVHYDSDDYVDINEEIEADADGLVSPELLHYIKISDRRWQRNISTIIGNTSSVNSLWLSLN